MSSIEKLESPTQANARGRSKMQTKPAERVTPIDKSSGARGPQSGGPVPEGTLGAK